MQKNKTSMKEKFKKLAKGGLMLPVTCLSTSLTVFAKGGDIKEITGNLTNLVALMTTIATSVGILLLIYNIWNLSQAYQSHDTAAFNQAIKGVIGSLFMAGISGVLKFLGY